MSFADYLDAGTEHATSIIRTLDSKNFKLFTRNKDRMKSEVMNLIGLLSVMILVGISVQGSSSSIDQGPAPPAISINATSVYMNSCYQNDYPYYMLPCYIYFGDNSTQMNGCSSELQTMMEDDVSFCKDGPSNEAEQQSIYSNSGMVIPICACSDPVHFTNVSWTTENQATTAFSFSSDLSGAYTMYAPTIGLTVDDLKDNNIQYRVNLTDTYNRATSSLASWQVAIEGAILGKSLDISAAYFPQEPFGTVDVSNVTFIPFYIALLIAYAMLSITTEICKEGKGSLRHGLFMIGLEPFVYWLGWFRMMCLRMSVTLIPLAIVVKLLIFSSTDTFLLVTVLLLISLWMMMFSMLCGILNVHPDSVNLVLVLFPSLCGSATYAYIPYLYNPGFEMVIPGYGTILLAFCFPPFGVALFFVIALSYEQVRNPLDFSTTLDMTPFEVSTAGLILSVAASTLVLIALNYFLIVKSRGTVARAYTKSASLSESTMHTVSQPSGCDISITKTTTKITDVESGGNGVAISVKSLSKHFVNNDGKVNRAVDELTVDFYENQITSFLGHNGAGKSTTMSLLTGLFAPDGGDASINGHSIVHDMEKVRPLLGVCPQENILWDLLTVRDHMKLFSRIRGIPDSQAKADIAELLKDIGLTDKKDTWAKDLSGGQKRKLQTACALIVDPKIIFLDEPTAGMDSSARRDMWDLLLKKKAGKCIILCTHQMDEADILGDRVAVVASGKIQAVGTPAALKTRYGRGTCLDISVRGGSDRVAILEAIQANGGKGTDVDYSEFADNEEEKMAAREEVLAVHKNDGDLRLVVPNNDGNNDLSLILQKLEDLRGVVVNTSSNHHEAGASDNNLSGIKDFGINSTTLEDVFWELGRQADEEAGVKNECKLPRELKLVPPTSRQMLPILLHRHWLDFKRGLLKQLFQSGYAFVYICAGIFFLSWNLKISTSGSSACLLNLTDDAFANVPTPYQVPYDGSNTPVPNMVDFMKSMAQQSNGKFPTPVNATFVSPCLSSWLVDSDDDNLCLYSEELMYDATATADDNNNNANNIYVGAYDFNSTSSSVDPSALTYTIFRNQSISNSLFGLISFANTGILSATASNNGEAPSTKKLSMSFYQWEKQESAEDSQTTEIIVNFILSNIGSFMFAIAINYLGARAAMQEVESKEKNVKQMQVLMGVTRFDYYIAQVAWDVLQFFAIVGIPMIVTFALDTRIADPAWILLMLLYILCVLPLIYTVSRLFQEAGPAYSSIAFVGLVTFAGLFVVYSVYGGVSLGSSNSSDDDTSSSTTDTLGKTLYFMFMLHPLFAISQGMVALTWASTFEYNPLLMSSPSSVPYGYTFDTAAWPCIYLAIESVLFSCMYLYVEYGGGTSPTLTAFILNIYQYMCRCVCIDTFYAGDVDEYGIASSKEEHADDDGLTLVDSLTKQEVEDDDVEGERKECLQLSTGMHQIAGHGSIELRHSCNSSFSAGAGSVLEAGNNIPCADVETGQHDEVAVLAHRVRIEYPPAGKQRYDGTIAVKDFSLRVRDRECFSLLGSNGAGKTSVMNILLKQQMMTSGEVYVRGEELYNLSDKVARTMSYCPQQNALFGKLTTRECLEFYCRVRGVPEDLLILYTGEWLNACDLGKHEHTWCDDLSGGNKRKLSLAIALIGNPSFVVLDEPSAGVDPAARRKLHGLINLTKRRGATIILTTHHMDEAQSLGDRVGIMVKGYLCCLGTVQHLLHKYSNGYLLTCCMMEGFPVQEHLMPAVAKICPDAKIIMVSGDYYCSVALGDSQSFSIAKLYALFTSLRGKSVNYFTVGQSRIEDVFLHFTEKLLKGDGVDSVKYTVEAKGGKMEA